MIEREVIVIAWIVSAVLGVVVQVLLLWDERRSLQAVNRTGRNGAVRLVARHDIRTDVFVLLVMLIFVVEGSLACVVVNRGEPPYSGIEQWAVEQFWRVLGYGVLAAIVLLVWKSVWKRYDRQQLLKTAIEEE